MAIPPLVLRIYADSSGVKKGVAQAQTQVGGLRASIAKNASLIKTGLVAGVVGGLAVSIKAAGDLGEAVNATNVTFKENAGVVRDWAKQAATSAGLAEAEALQAAAGMGAMFESAGLAGEASAKMSVDVAQLAGDIASLRNADPTEMLERMRAGLAGEAEPLRRFGIFISEARVEQEAFRMGLAKTGETLTDAQKIQARYNIILKDASEAQGDFARTAGTSLPNQLRMLRAQFINLAASLGKVLLPIVTKLLGAFNAIIGPITKVVDILGGATDPIRGASDALQELGLEAVEARRRIDEVSAAVTDSEDALQGGRTMGAAMAVALEDLVEQERRAAHEADSWATRQKALMDQQRALRVDTNHLGSTFRRFANVGEEAWDKFTEAANTSIDFVGAAFDTLAGKAKLTAEKIIRAFRRQAEAALNYEQNLKDVARRNIPDVLLQHIVSLGDDGAAILAELARAGDQKFNQMVRAMMRTISAEKRVENAIDDLHGAIVDLPDFVTIRLNVVGANPGDLRFGQRQGGGPVSAGTPYWVNERGPEIFVPRDAGKVVPLGGDGAAAPQVRVYIGDEEVQNVVVKAINGAAGRM